VLKVVREYSRGFRTPSYQETWISFIEEMGDNIHKGLEKYKKDREKWGCTRCFLKTDITQWQCKPGIYGSKSLPLQTSHMASWNSIAEITLLISTSS